MEIMKILNCTAENLLSFLFMALLSKRRFKNPLALLSVIAAGSAVGYLFVGAVLPLRTLTALAVLLSGSLLLFAEKAEILSAYSLIALFIRNISDLIFGSFAAAILNGRFSEIMLPSSAERLIIQLFSAALLGMLCPILRKIEEPVPRKFWRLFDMVMLGFLTVTVIFSGAYSYSAIGSDKGNMITVAVIALIFSASCITVIYFFTEICIGAQRGQRLKLLETNYNYFCEQLVLQSEHAQTLKKLRHDIINHLTNVRSLISLNDIDGAARLLDETAQQTENAALGTVNTGNRIADAVIMSKSALCRSKGIVFEYKLEPMDNFSVSAADISSLLSNLLDNAAEAAERAKEPHIALDIFDHNAYHVIRVENSIAEAEKLSLQTAKPNAALHGYGMKIIGDIAVKYGGSFTVKSDGGRFIATVFIKKGSIM